MANETNREPRQPNALELKFAAEYAKAFTTGQQSSVVLKDGKVSVGERVVAQGSWPRTRSPKS